MPPFDAARKARFLQALAVDGLASPAAAAAGVPVAVALEAADPDGAAYDAAFAVAWVQAMEGAADRLEQEAWRRAVDGISEPVIRGGQQVGEVVKYSDALLVRLLQARRPARFGTAAARAAQTEDAPIQVMLSADDAEL